MAKKIRTVIDTTDGVSAAEASAAGSALAQARRALVSDASAVFGDVVYVVNPRGCVHVVTVAHWNELRARDPRYRLATDEERAAYDAAFEQRFDAPLGKPYGG